jgi:ubiquinone/menaquinone biosynthesis C-methylase UbiE
MREINMTLTDKLHFQMISLVHEKLYTFVRNPYQDLRSAGLRGGQVALEIGCGPGFFTLPAAAIVGSHGHLVSLDINPWAVKSTQQKVKEAGLENVEVLLGDASNTGLPCEHFDLIFIFGLGHAEGDLENILVESHRTLKRSGSLAIEGRLQPPDRLFQKLPGSGRILRYHRIN